MKRSFEKFIARIDSLGLREKLEKRAALQHRSLLEIYEGARVRPVVEARRAIYAWLSAKENMGINEIARVFDRSSSAVSALLREKSNAQ